MRNAVYANESKEYRDARDALLKDEQELVAKVKSVAEKRRKLPVGGQLKEDYVFQWANDGKVGRMSDSPSYLRTRTLCCFTRSCSVRTGTIPVLPVPRWSMGSIALGIPVTRALVFVAIAKAPADRIDAWAKRRGWSQIALVSGSNSTYQADYKCQGDSDDMQWPVMHVFKRQGEKFSISGEQKRRGITSTRCGRIGI